MDDKEFFKKRRELGGPIMKIKTKEDYLKVQSLRMFVNGRISLPLGRKNKTKSGKKKENK